MTLSPSTSTLEDTVYGASVLLNGPWVGSLRMSLSDGPTAESRFSFGISVFRAAKSVLTKEVFPTPAEPTTMTLKWDTAFRLDRGAIVSIEMYKVYCWFFDKEEKEKKRKKKESEAHKRERWNKLVIDCPIMSDAMSSAWWIWFSSLCSINGGSGVVLSLIPPTCLVTMTTFIYS